MKHISEVLVAVLDGLAPLAPARNLPPSQNQTRGGAKAKRKPKPVYANAVLRAIEGSQKLPALSRAELKGIVTRAQHDFGKGIDCEANWRSMADALNVAEALSELGICSDPQSRDRISLAHAALGYVAERNLAGGSWTLRASEMQAIDAGLWLHRTQIDFCSLSEYERAVKTVAIKTSQALAGNAGPGVQIIDVKGASA